MPTTDDPASAANAPGHTPATTARHPDFAPDSTDVRPGDDPPDPARGPAATNGLPPTASATHAARPSDAQAFARLIAAGRRPRSRRFTDLEPYRDVLLAERRAGASIRLMAESLAKVGVAISEETLRVWLLKHKLPKRRRTHQRAADVKPAPVAPAAVAAPAFVPAWQRKGPRIARDDF